MQRPHNRRFYSSEEVEEATKKNLYELGLINQNPGDSSRSSDTVSNRSLQRKTIPCRINNKTVTPENGFSHRRH